MIKDYREDLFTNAMKKIGLAGFADLFEKDIPVVIKQDFIVNGRYFLKAGTIGCLEKIEPYNIDYKKDFAVCNLRLITPRGDINLFCKISDSTDNIKVFGLKEAVEFQTLFEVSNERTGRKLVEYKNLKEDYYNKDWRYDNNTETAAYICFAVAGLSLFVSLIGLVAYGNMPLGITAIAVAAIVALVAFILYNISFGKTKKGKAMDGQIEDLKEELLKIDEELCEQYADNTATLNS